MSSSESRNGVLRRDIRPGSARGAREKDPVRRNDSPAIGSTDLSKVIDAIATLQTVDLTGLRRRLESTSTYNLKNVEDGQNTNIKWAENVDWKNKYMDLKEQYDTLTAQLKSTQTISSEQKRELVELQQRVESGDKSLKSLKQNLEEYKNELESKEKRLQTQQKAMEELKKAKDEALTRLSRQMGQQMSEGNPNITDLSDQNRPSKLGEIYAELYDNEWTDAFESLTETFHLDDTNAIGLLHKILRESSKYASDVSQSSMKEIEKLLSGSSEGPTLDCKRLLREARRHVDVRKADIHFQDFVRKKLTSLVENIHLRETTVKIYSEKCFQLCWLMSIQDPPVVLSKDPEKGAHFDINLYKHFTSSGDTVDYVVWPALLLHKDGPLLAKGVAQPSPRPRAKSAPAGGSSARRVDKSFDRKSEVQYDTKVRETASGSHGIDKTHNGHQSVNDNTIGGSTFGFEKMVMMQDGYNSRNYETSRESTSVSNRMDKTHYARQSRNDKKIRESPSYFHRMDETCYGHQTQNDAAVLAKLDDSLMVTKAYSADGGKPRVHLPTPNARTQGQISGYRELFQPQGFLDDFDKGSFKRFCQNALVLDELQLRGIYGTYYDRYYTLYVNQTHGNYRFI